jgi:undecaprenyl-diphosphatase
MRNWTAVEDGLTSLLPNARQGDTFFGRLGDVAQQPPVWALLAAGLAVLGGARGKRAALRGTASYGAAAVVANLVIKPLVRRSRPPASGKGRLGPVTTSFPSGHAATDLAFAVGVAGEIPWMFIPLAGLTLAAHWSLVRSRGHYPTDVLAGGAIGLAVGLVLWKLWPPRTQPAEEDAEPISDGGGR